MEERKFVDFKKGEYRVKEFIKESLGKGKVSKVRLEYTPVGEKIVVLTNKPGYIIGKQGAKINELTFKLKKNFKLENPHIEIGDIGNPDLDAQTVADEIAFSLERFGSSRFKAIAYKFLVRIMKAGARGVEIRLSGRLPSERAKSWRFAQGYLKKTGDSARLVDRARAVAQTKSGISGVKVSILHPNLALEDQIVINDDIRNKIKANMVRIEAESIVVEKPKKAKKKVEKKTESKETEKELEEEDGGN